MKEIIKSCEDLLENISYALVLHSNIETPEKEQQEIIKLTEEIMKNKNKVC